jgi:transposase
MRGCGAGCYPYASPAKTSGFAPNAWCRSRASGDDAAGNSSVHRLANLPLCLIGMEACVGAHHLSRKLQMLGHDARLMLAKYVRPYSTGEKNDFRDAEAITEAVQRPTMKFVATKTAKQLDLQALHRVRERLVSQRTGIINQIRAFLLERGVAVRQGLRFLHAELPRILAAPCDALSPRMLRVIEEDLAGDWRRLDDRIEGLSSEIEALARQDEGCARLMTVPGIGPIISSAMLAASAREMRSRKAATSARGLGWYRNKSRPETEQSSAAYQSEAIAICAPYSSRRPGWCWSGSGQSIGSAMGSSRGSKRRRSDCITTSLPSRSLTSSPAWPGASSLLAELSRLARFRPRDSTRIVETPYLPRPARGLETRWSIGLPGRMRTLVTQMAP